MWPDQGRKGKFRGEWKGTIKNRTKSYKRLIFYRKSKISQENLNDKQFSKENLTKEQFFKKKLTSE